MCGLDAMAGRGPHRRLRQRGMSLIELMVGIVVALLIALAAIGSAQFFMGRQRASLDVGSAAGNETNGLAAMKHELAQAGLGFFADGHALCEALDLSQLTGAPTAPAAPIAIGLGAGGATIEVLHGSALEAVSPALLAAAATSADASLTLASYLPVAPGQRVMMVPASASAAPCTVRTATGVTAATADTPLTLQTAASPAGTAVAYGTSDALVALGQLSWSRFRLDAGSLVMERPFDGTRSVIVRNVVAFAAEYGVADAGGSSVGSWQAATGAWATLDRAHLATVRAVRIGLVVRSALPEKKDASGACGTTLLAPTLFGNAVDLGSDPDAACYRYRTGTAIVPLRNVVFGSGA